MIFHYDIRYTLARLFVNTAFRLYFRKLIFVGKKENVSVNHPIILAPNHRNALLDALLLVYTSRPGKQIVFLARADIFKRKSVAGLLRGLRIIPVFRLRDGKENLEKNEEIFRTSAEILKRNNPLALFPEGRHNPKQSLLPIQKAIPRIVLPTEASADFRLNSRIVPVAIYYRDITEFLSDVYVTFGTPIEVSKYREAYRENPSAAINQLRHEMGNSLKTMVVNIQNDAYYDAYGHAIDWNRDRLAQTMFADRKDAVPQAALHIVRTLDERFTHNRPLFDDTINRLRKAFKIVTDHGLTTQDDIRNPLSGWALFARYALLVLTAPLMFLGLLNGIFPLLLSKKLQRLFKEKQFIPSARYIAGLFFVPLFDLIQSLVAGLLTHSLLVATLYFIAMPALFYLALYERKRWKKTNRDFRVARFVKNFPEVWKQVISFVTI